MGDRTNDSNQRWLCDHLMGLDRLARGKLVSEPPAGSTDSARAMSPMTRSCPVGLVRRQAAGGMSCLEH